ncbi:hypothetical protein [Actinomadura sp. B10D3]|uniref:hypothetical protein n=1 Tax=Actinomadura sp. B10D3 TaxID=3153557 RepID=UPI00325EC785
MAIDRLVTRREVHLREKTLWRMLYETAGRAEEILGLNIEDLDFAGRRCLVKAKGARSKARRGGQAREDFVLETVYWDASCTTRRMSPQVTDQATADIGVLSVGRLQTGPPADAPSAAHQGRLILSAGFRSDVPQPPT